jgi:hypothetical protein
MDQPESKLMVATSLAFFRNFDKDGPPPMPGVVYTIGGKKVVCNGVIGEVKDFYSLLFIVFSNLLVNYVGTENVDSKYIEEAVEKTKSFAAVLDAETARTMIRNIKDPNMNKRKLYTATSTMTFPWDGDERPKLEGVEFIIGGEKLKCGGMIGNGESLSDIFSTVLCDFFNIWAKGRDMGIEDPLVEDLLNNVKKMVAAIDVDKVRAELRKVNSFKETQTGES